MNAAGAPNSGNLIVYVANGNSGDIIVSRLDRDSAELTELQRVSVPQWDGPNLSMPMAVHPNKRVLYVNMRSPTVIQSFRIDPQSGRLSHMEGSIVQTPECLYIALDRTARYLLGACYRPQRIIVLPIKADGAPGPMQQSVSMPGMIHSVQTDASNRFVFYSECTRGAFARRNFDAATGKVGDDVEEVNFGHVRPRHFAFSRDQRHLYLLNEGDGLIDVLGYDAKTGAFSHRATVNTVPEGTDHPTCADIHMTPDGRFLYSTDRTSNTLALFRCDANTGVLTPAGHFPTEDSPRTFAITPDGKMLLAAGQKADKMTVYRIDQNSGALRPAGSYKTGGNPTWIEIVELG